jgi:hypothetical protein
MPFQPGQSGNPLGRPRGVIDQRRQIRLMLESHAEAILSEAVRRALAGSDTLLGLLVGRLIASPRSESLSLEIDKPSQLCVRWIGSDGGVGDKHNI